MNRRSCVVAIGLITSGGAAAAQQPQLPPVRPLGPVVAVSRDSLSSVSSVVQVAGGKVYVNDITARRVLLYDSTLAHPEVIADSAGETSNSYGAMPGTLLPFHGDSALFITPSSLSMEVLAPGGTVARVLAMPPSGRGWPPAGVLIGNIFGTPGFDAHGRLVYFSPVRLEFRGGPPGEGTPMNIEPPDSAFLVRFDFGTRTLDTAGAFHIPHSRSSMTRDDKGGMHMSITAVPPQPIDDWAVMADGRIAVVRGRDYHVDWLGADGAWTASPRIPFAWEHVDDAQKAALVDSMAAALQLQIDSMPARMQRAGFAAPGAQGRGQGAAGGGGGGGTTMTIVMGGPGGDRAPAGGGPPVPSGGPTRVSITPTVIKAAVSDVPDYRPPFRQGSVRSDLDGNIWIRTSKVENGQPVYDVVNGEGRLVDRVQLPPFRTIAGFGPGVVYMGVQDSTGTAHLERARVR